MHSIAKSREIKKFSGPTNNLTINVHRLNIETPAYFTYHTHF